MKLFTLDTLTATLLKKTKTIRIERSELEPDMSLNFLEDLEKVLLFCANHREIKTIYFSSAFDYFGHGQKLNEDLLALSTKLQELIFSFFYLPQTMIVDYKNGASLECMLLGLAADIRIGNINAKFDFNFLNKAIHPYAGGISLMQFILGESFTRKFIFTPWLIQTNDLVQSGFIHHFYEQVIEEDFLIKLSEQDDIARIQFKRGLLQNLLHQMDSMKHFESTLLKATLKLQSGPKTKGEERVQEYRI
jgi:enoyl-CoA hydratase/carnithine racemase